MPSKKRKYNARFPAGRIKKIMQTDEEVGKVAQAVPIIISRTLELFVESLLTKAMQVTTSRNAKTLSPSHVKQCILAESRFDFLRDLVKNIPDVSAAEENEIISDATSPNSSRCSDTAAPSRSSKDETNCSSEGQVHQILQLTRDSLKRSILRKSNDEHELPNKIHRTEVTSTIVSSDTVIDLSIKSERVNDSEQKSTRIANFYQEIVNVEPEVQHSVICINPSYSNPQPSTSTKVQQRLTDPEVKKEIITAPDKNKHRLPIANNSNTITASPRTPVTPILNIDFTKSILKPEIKVLDSVAANIVGVTGDVSSPVKTAQLPAKTNSKLNKDKKYDFKSNLPHPVDIDRINSGNLQIDEDYDT